MPCRRKLVAIAAALWWGLAPESANRVHDLLAQFFWHSHAPVGAAAGGTAPAVSAAEEKKGENLLIEVVIGNVRYRFPMQLSKKDGTAAVREALPIELAQ